MGILWSLAMNLATGFHYHSARADQVFQCCKRQRMKSLLDNSCGSGVDKTTLIRLFRLMLRDPRVAFQIQSRCLSNCSEVYDVQRHVVSIRKWGLNRHDELSDMKVQVPVVMTEIRFKVHGQRSQNSHQIYDCVYCTDIRECLITFSFLQKKRILFFSRPQFSRDNAVFLG